MSGLSVQPISTGEAVVVSLRSRILDGVIVPGARGESAKRMAESIRIAVSAQGPDAGPTPTASIGWAVFPEDGESFETLMHCADQRMMNLKASRQAEVVSLLDSPA